MKAEEGTLVLLSQPEEGDCENVISWPGEYDDDGISIRALARGSDQMNYIVTVEGVRLGFLSSPLPEFTEEDEEIIGDLDVLVLPAEDPKKAQKLVEDIDPRIVIPLKMTDGKIFTDVLAACGGKEAAEVEELKLKQGSLPSETREVYVLKG